MDSRRIIILVFALSVAYSPALGRPLDDYDDLGNEIDPFTELTVTEESPRISQAMEHPVQQSIETLPPAHLTRIKVPEKSTRISPTTAKPVQRSTIDTTTEYKYKDIIEAYTIEVPKLESVRHAAGTLYYTVDPQEDPYKKLMQVYQDNFETPMNRNLPKNVPPPKD
uniref:Putative conserved secreted protein n=1 Tax=Aedes albopictus TaxID=7160 RepID=A0A1W7R7G7_AEDAL